MTLPKENFQVKVGGFMYDVIYSKDISDQGGCYGSTHYSSQKIFIDPEMHIQMQEETFLHEVIHALMFVSGLGYKLEKGKESEESIIRLLTHPLYQFIKDNNLLFK